MATGYSITCDKCGKTIPAGGPLCHKPAGWMTVAYHHGGGCTEYDFCSKECTAGYILKGGAILPRIAKPTFRQRFTRWIAG